MNGPPRIPVVPHRSGPAARRGRNTARAALVFGALALASGAAASIPLVLTSRVPSAPTSALDRGRALLDQGKLAEAEPVLLQAAKEHPDNPEAHAALAALYLEKNDGGKAIESAKKAVALRDSVASYHLLLAQAHAVDAMSGNPLAALASAPAVKRELETTLALDPRSSEARYQLVLFHLVAPELVGGSQQEAEKQAGVLQKTDPLTGAYAWAQIWGQREDYARQEAAIREAVARDTSQARQASQYLGRFYQGRERYAAAESVFASILKKQPGNMLALYQLGRTYVLAKTKLDKARDIFLRYLGTPPPRGAPSWAAAHYRLGMVHDLQGKRDLALAEYRKAVAMEPENKEFGAALKKAEEKR